MAETPVSPHFAHLQRPILAVAELSIGVRVPTSLVDVIPEAVQIGMALTPVFDALNAIERPVIAALRGADAVILSSPAYHGGLSGLLKNALDYVEELRGDPRPYLNMCAVGCIVCASGTQAIGTSLTSMRSIVHALRGWPTPLGVGINTAVVSVDVDGTCSEPEINVQIGALARQVVDFAKMSAGSPQQALCAAE